MTKFAISPEGADALRKLSGRLIDSLNEIELASNQLDSELKSLSDELGVYESSIGGLVADCKKAICGKTQYVSSLAKSLSEKASTIESLIGLDGSLSSSESHRTYSLFKTRSAVVDEQSRRWNETYMPLVKANIRKGVADHFADYVTEEKLESSLKALEFMNLDELKRRSGFRISDNTLGYNDGSSSNVASNFDAEAINIYSRISPNGTYGFNPAFVTAVHETMHMMSANDTQTKAKRGIMRCNGDSAMNEAITEYYTFIATGGNTPLGGLYPGIYSGYNDIKDFIPAIEGYVGVDCLKEAYFHNRPEIVALKIDQKCGSGTWDCLCRDFSLVQDLNPNRRSESQAAAIRIRAILDQLR